MMHSKIGNTSAKIFIMLLSRRWTNFVSGLMEAKSLCRLKNQFLPKFSMEAGNEYPVDIESCSVSRSTPKIASYHSELTLSLEALR